MCNRLLRGFYRKNLPVGGESGGKLPLCAVGVPPGRSSSIGGCARAPCVFLAAAEGTARGCSGVRGAETRFVPNCA